MLGGAGAGRSGDAPGPPGAPAFAGAVQCRSSSAASAMDDPAARQIIQACAEAGEQAAAELHRASR